MQETSMQHWRKRPCDPRVHSKDSSSEDSDAAEGVKSGHYNQQQVRDCGILLGILSEDLLEAGSSRIGTHYCTIILPSKSKLSVEIRQSLRKLGYLESVMECPECGEKAEETVQLNVPETVLENGTASVDPSKSKVTQLNQYAQEVKEHIEAKNGTEELLPIIKAVEDADRYCVGTGLSMGESSDKIIFYIH